ncbi:glycosyl transferase family 2 [Alphaproteobacteria bacterium 46_93_T64]|nr:glycosyl transferase family 2 [Alphaproteobacteria bacterium 46_93_T64]
MSVPDLSVVIPIYNEEAVLLEFQLRINSVLSKLDLSYELLYVNDGSTDNTLNLLQQLKTEDTNVCFINLSRNFGKEAAVTAGIDNAAGRAIIIIDADLQDPPELIPELIKPWRDDGIDVVYARRRSRAGESWIKKTTASFFYRVMGQIGPVALPRDTGDFRLMSRRSVEALKTLREQHRFMKGLFAWVGFPQQEVLYDRDKRFAGETKWNYFKLWNFSLDGITGFTTAPLKLATYLGFIIATFAGILGLKIIFETLVNGADVPGYPSVMVVILFLGGTQLMFMGILGEYVGRIFNESKNRPLYLIQDFEKSNDLQKFDEKMAVVNEE